MQKVTPFLWFDDNLEEAINYYMTVFEKSKIISLTRAGAEPDSPVFSAVFEVEGQVLHAINGGPYLKLNPAFSLFVSCNNQEEVDRLWDRLCDGGEAGRCGWLVDKFGLSWQIIPTRLGELMGDPDQVKAARARDAMMTMNKIDIEALERAFSSL